PEDETYVSKEKFSKKTDFSGKLHQRFEAHRQHRDWKRYARLVIPDVEVLEGVEETFSPIQRRPHQTYIKTIAGNVIYCRNDQREIEVVGVLNLDSHIPNAISEERYRALQPYLFPAFRLLANRLLLLKRCPQLIDSLRALN